MAYFKYSLLNSLRDELDLTMTRQRATAFLFLYLAIPAAGAGLGVGFGMQAHSPLKTFVAGASGLALGGVVAWQLPRVLWGMLRLCARKGWFLQPEQRQGVPVMTGEEFIARSRVLRREERRQFLVWTLLFIAGAFGCARLSFYMDRAKPQGWVQVVAGLGIATFFVGYFLLRGRAAKLLVKKHGLQCSACGREITGAAGLSCMPHMGLCRHCGAKVIEI
jgi:hypothetical protein